MMFLFSLLGVGALIRLASAKTSAQLCHGTQELSNGNWYCTEVKAITFKDFSQPGTYNRTTRVNPSTGLCDHEPVSYAGVDSATPLIGELSMHLRGPMNISQIAVYILPDSSISKRSRTLQDDVSDSLAQDGDRTTQVQPTESLSNAQAAHVKDSSGLKNHGARVGLDKRWFCSATPTTTTTIFVTNGICLPTMPLSTPPAPIPSTSPGPAAPATSCPLASASSSTTWHGTPPSASPLLLSNCPCQTMSDFHSVASVAPTSGVSLSPSTLFPPTPWLSQITSIIQSMTPIGQSPTVSSVTAVVPPLLPIPAYTIVPLPSALVPGTTVAIPPGPSVPGTTVVVPTSINGPLRSLVSQITALIGPFTSITMVPTTINGLPTSTPRPVTTIVAPTTVNGPLRSLVSRLTSLIAPLTSGLPGLPKPTTTTAKPPTTTTRVTTTTRKPTSTTKKTTTTKKPATTTKKATTTTKKTTTQKTATITKTVTQKPKVTIGVGVKREEQRQGVDSGNPLGRSGALPHGDQNVYVQAVSDWTRVAYYTSTSPAAATGLTFLANLGDPQESGTFDYAFGNSLSYVIGDGSKVSATSTPFSGTLETSEREIAVFTDKICDGNCEYSRPNATSHYGWTGSSKAFLMEFSMDHYNNTGTDQGLISDAPAWWFLNAAIPRILQYGNDKENIPCSCWSTGCGELDAFEILSQGDMRAKATIHRQGNREGGDSNYFLRPVGQTIKFAVVFHNWNITARVLDDNFDFSSGLSQDQIDGILAYDSEDNLHSLFAIGD